MLTIRQSLWTMPIMIPQAEEVWGRISLPHCSRLRIFNPKFNHLFEHFEYFKYQTQSSIISSNILNISNIQSKVQFSFQIFQIFNSKFNSVFEYFKYSTQSSNLFSNILNISNIQLEIQFCFRSQRGKCFSGCRRQWAHSIKNPQVNSVNPQTPLNTLNLFAFVQLWMYYIYCTGRKQRNNLVSRRVFIFLYWTKCKRDECTQVALEVILFNVLYCAVKENNFVSRRFYILMSTHKWHFKWCSLHKISSGH